MSQFIQLHLLTSYPPSNLNRDELGRPKTAIMGSVNRLRVSSQSLKRAWRTSDLYRDCIGTGSVIAFSNEIGKDLAKRTKEIGPKWIKGELLSKGVSEELAELWSKDITLTFGQVEKDENKLSQVVYLSPSDLLGCDRLVVELIEFIVDEKENELFSEITDLQEKRSKKKKADEIKKINKRMGDLFRPHILGLGQNATDMALFGRMLASSPAYNIEAAAQVSHAITVHSAKVDEDYFTAVDDLNNHEDDAGAAHIGEAGFAAGLFYAYICINRDLLIENLQGDEALANKTIAALIECAAKVSPTGKQNSFASRAHASYMLAEKGTQQPRSLSVAFLKPIQGSDQAGDAIDALIKQRDNFDKVYGQCAEGSQSMNAMTGEGSLEELIAFVTE